MKYADDTNDVGVDVPLEMYDLDTSTGDIPVHVGPERDEKGRLRVDLMSGRELLEEIVANQRNMSDTVASFVAAMETNPMLKMMGGKMLGKR